LDKNLTGFENLSGLKRTSTDLINTRFSSCLEGAKGNGEVFSISLQGLQLLS
jgi:hypothetical protein